MRKIFLPEKQIIDQYTNKKLSVNQLSKLYKVSRWKIQSILNEHQIIKNSRKLILQYDESFFNNDCSEKYYFFGFSLGDGSLVKQGNRFKYTITLNKKDDCVIKQFIHWLSLEKEHIKYYTKFARLTLYGDIWQKDWSKLGLVPQKTYNPSMLEIPTQYLAPFIIGLIDADGSISFKKDYSLSVIGHPDNMNWVISVFRKIGFGGKINEQLVKNKWKRIRIQRKNDIIELATLLELEKYYHFVLERKWKLLYENILNFK